MHATSNPAGTVVTLTLFALPSYTAARSPSTTGALLGAITSVFVALPA